MKNVLFVTFAMALLLFAFTSLGETYTSMDFEYALLENGDAALIWYTGNKENVIIPNTLNGHPIMTVLINPFLDYNSDTNIGIKNCKVSVAVDHPYLATINGVLFGQSDRKLISYFPSLPEQYAIPQGILIIGDYAFTGCTNLTSVTIPNSVKTIGEYAFALCSGLGSVSIPDSVTSIGIGAFYKCSSLTSVSIQDGVTSIEHGSFFGCSSLTSVSIPDSVTNIGKEAFADCTSLLFITIPDSVTSIGENAFGLYNRETYTYDSHPNLILAVSPGSYAESYCIENGLAYTNPGITYGDNDSWLN